MMMLDKLVFSKFEKDDFEIYYALVQKDSVMKYITGQGSTREEAQEKFRSIITINGEEREIGYFKVYEIGGGFIGLSKLEWYVKDPSLLEVGYILKEEFWGRGYGTLVCREMMALADRVAPTVDVIGIIDPENIASKRLLQNFGLQSYFLGIEDGLATEKLKLAR